MGWNSRSLTIQEGTSNIRFMTPAETRSRAMRIALSPNSSSVRTLNLSIFAELAGDIDAWT